MKCNILIYDSWDRPLEKLSSYDRGVKIVLRKDEEAGIVHLGRVIRVDCWLAGQEVAVPGTNLLVSDNEVSFEVPNVVMQNAQASVLNCGYVLKDGDEEMTRYHAEIDVEGRPQVSEKVYVNTTNDRVNLPDFEEVVNRVKSLETKRTEKVGIGDLKAEVLTKIEQAHTGLETPDNPDGDIMQAFTELDAIRNMIYGLSEQVDLKVDGYYRTYEGKIQLTAGGMEVGEPFFAGGGGGGGGGGGSSSADYVTFKVDNITGWNSTNIINGASAIAKFEWSSIEEGESTGRGLMRINVNGAVKASLNVEQGLISVNLADYIESGNNTVRVTISDVYEHSRTMIFYVNLIDLSITSHFDSSQAFTGPIAFSVIPYGATQKTLYVLVDGITVYSTTTMASGRQVSCALPKQSHGAHKIECYFEAMVEGTLTQSNHLYYEIICVDEGSRGVILTSDFSTEEADQYTSIVIPYSAYDPSSVTAQVKLYANNVLVNTVTVDRSRQIWTYRADTAGTLNLKLECGSESRSFTITINPVDLHVEAESDALQLYLSAYGRSNGEANPAVWTHGSTAATFTDFNFVTDGWQTDKDGISVLRVEGDARLTIPFQIFKDDFRTTGKTIEFEFATRNCRDYDATLISCMAGGRGLTVTAQEAKLKSEQSEISAQFKEEEHLRIGFVVEKRMEHRLIYVYIDGILSRVVRYPADDDFHQTSPVSISIGSSDCGIDLYCIRVYNNDLTKEQMVTNWIADTQNGTLLRDRFSRNRVYDEYGRITIDKLPKNIPYIVLEAPELSQYKGDKKTVSGQYVNPVHPEESYTFSDAQLNVQGTSSQYYARKNYKLTFKNGVTFSTGKADKVSVLGGLPVETLCLKADVASSEGANNTALVRLYNDTCTYKTPGQLTDARLRQGIDGFPIVVFHNDGTQVSFLGKYNCNNDKSNEAVFGFKEGDESWETLNNTDDLALFKSADFTSWANTFEGRFPDGNEDITKLKAFAEWVVSTKNDPTKFKAELSTHCNVESALFYWLFTELFLMVDSRAKNAFPTRYNDEGKWVWLPYDFDTGLGTNNEGSLVFDYHWEDTDHLPSGANIFNGQDSVFWTNLRSAYATELGNLYRTLRSTGALSYAKVKKAFDDHQAVWPESVFNEDAQYKYLDPLITEGSAEYLSMLQGSKKSQRDWWLYNRFRYMDSKYNAGDDAQDVIQLRGYAKSNVTVTPYTDLYVNVKFGSVMTSKRTLRNTPSEMVCPLSNVNDTEIYIYSASRLSSVGDLSGLKVGYADFSQAVKLEDLKLGSNAEGYTNGNMTELHLGNNPMLKTLDCRNCTALGTGTQATVDVSGCTGIEEIYMENTKITGINLPVGGQLRKLHLPNTITALVIRNQKQLTDLDTANAANISTLRIENSSVDVDAFLTRMKTGARVRYVGYEETFATSAACYASLTSKYDKFKGLDENGLNTEKAQIAGVAHITSARGDELAQIRAAYPLIQIDAEHVACDVKYYNHDGSTLLHTETVLDGGNATWAGTGPSRPATPQNTFSFSGWASTPNGTRWADAQKNVTEDRNLYAAYTITGRTYTVTFKNGSTTLQTVNNVPYGGSATYSGNTSELKDADGNAFISWVPSPTNIQADTVCVAQFRQAVPGQTEIADSWDTILANIQNGSYKTKYTVGSYKPLSFGDEGTINMQIVGIDVDTKPDGTKAPLTFLGYELLKTSKRWNPSDNSGGWENSELRTYLRETILPTVPANIRSAIVPVTKTQSLHDSPGTQTTTETLWIPSRTELFGDFNPDRGQRYSLFTSDSSRIKHNYGSTSGKAYWTRSASTGNSRIAYGVQTNGGRDDYDVYSTYGLAVGFCLGDAEQVVDAEITDSWETILANINNGTYKTKYQLGNYKPLDLGDEGTVNMQIVAFDHDAKASGSGNASTTWIAKELLKTSKRWNPSDTSGGWENSELRTYLRETILPTVPANIRSAIVPVTKTQSLYGTPSTQTTTETLWIPSRMEMFGDLSADGGRKYAPFKDNASRVKHEVGLTSADDYWTRSANAGISYSAYYVRTNGGWSGRDVYNASGLAVGFCL